MKRIIKIFKPTPRDINNNFNYLDDKINKNYNIHNRNLKIVCIAIFIHELLNYIHIWANS